MEESKKNTKIGFVLNLVVLVLSAVLLVLHLIAAPTHVYRSLLCSNLLAVLLAFDCVVYCKTIKIKDETIDALSDSLMEKLED